MTVLSVLFVVNACSERATANSEPSAGQQQSGSSTGDESSHDTGGSTSIPSPDETSESNDAEPSATSDSATSDPDSSSGDGATSTSDEGTGSDTGEPIDCTDVFVPRVTEIVCTGSMSECEAAQAQADRAMNFYLRLLSEDEAGDALPPDELARRRDCIATAIEQDGGQVSSAHDNEIWVQGSYTQVETALGYAPVYSFEVECTGECSEHCFDLVEGDACRADGFCHAISGSPYDEKRACMLARTYAACSGSGYTDDAPTWRQHPSGTCWWFRSQWQMPDTWQGDGCLHLDDGAYDVPPCDD